MKLEPTRNRIVAKKIDLQKETAGGILLTNTAGKTSNTAEITHVGPDVKGFEVGDKVIYIDHMFFDLEGETRISFLDTQVLAKLV